MPRKSLRPHLNQIRAWVREGRTDAWVAHQLDVSVREIEQFKRQNELVSDDDAPDGARSGHYEEEIDLRAEDDALIAAELEAAEIDAARAKEQEEAEAREAEERAAEERAEAQARAQVRAGSDAPDDDDDDGEEASGGRLRRRRGGRGRRSLIGRSRRGNTGPLEGTFDHGEEGYGLWLDPAIVDNPVYAEHWAGHRPVEVVVEEDPIVIRRVGDDD
jgi:hypothetical protein